MSDITLSITIPTYKRAELLKLLLDSIVQDIEQWPDDLELIVSDNASPDETRSVVSAFLQKGFPIKYVVNTSNIGADRNIASSFNLATGKYVWVIGDDEIMYRGTIQYVLELCRSKQFGVLHLSSRGFGHGQQNAIKLKSKPERVVIKKLEPRKFIRLANVFLTFISANVVNKEAILRHNPSFNAESVLLNNTNMIQLAWIYSAIKAESAHYFVRTPLFGALGGNSGGYDLIEVFGMNLLGITKKYFKDSYPDAEHIIENAVITMLLPAEIMAQFGDSARKNQFNNGNVIDAATRIFNNNFYFKFFIRPIFSGPALFRKIGFIVVKIFNKLNRKLNFVLL